MNPSIENTHWKRGSIKAMALMGEGWHFSVIVSIWEHSKKNLLHILIVESKEQVKTHQSCSLITMAFTWPSWTKNGSTQILFETFQTLTVLSPEPMYKSLSATFYAMQEIESLCWWTFFFLGYMKIVLFWGRVIAFFGLKYLIVCLWHVPHMYFEVTMCSEEESSIS